MTTSMKKYLTLTGLLLLCFLSKTADAAHVIVPHKVGGFVLGEPIEKFKHMVDMSTRMNVRYREFLYEVEIKPLKGFKSGLIAVGNCADPGKIVRIKLKYADSGKDFFNQLLKRFKARFGQPTEYQGDPFRVFIVWKWRFIDENHNQINLILQHNHQDEDEKIGNAVKMTHINLLEKERQCFMEKERRAGKPKDDKIEHKTTEIKPDWKLLIPR